MIVPTPILGKFIFQVIQVWVKFIYWECGFFFPQDLQKASKITEWKGLLRLLCCDGGSDGSVGGRGRGGSGGSSMMVVNQTTSAPPLA